MMMSNDAGWNIAILPALELTAPRQIGVFIVEKKAFIEDAHFFEIAFLQQYGASAPCKHILGFVVLTRVCGCESTIPAKSLRVEPRSGVLEEVIRALVNTKPLRIRPHRDSNPIQGGMTWVGGAEPNFNCYRVARWVIAEREVELRLIGRGPPRHGLAEAIAAIAYS